MQLSYRIIFFLKNFCTGLLMPVMTLLILDRGISLSALAWVLGAYSVMAVIMEFPSGVFCDLYGRKKTFLLSEILMLISYFLFLMCRGAAGIVFALAVQGCGRAFSSGSLDALMIDQAGKENLAKVNGRMGVLESAGIAAGNILSGFLAGIGHQYSWNLTGILIGHGIVLGLTILKVNGPEVIREKTDGIGSKMKLLGQQTVNCARYALSTEAIRRLTVVLFFTGAVLFTVETYWQPGFRDKDGMPGEWMLGIAGCIGFIATSLGSLVVQKLLEKWSQDSQWWKILFAFQTAFAVLTVAFGWSSSWVRFLIHYVLIYLMLGAGNVAGNSLLARHTVNEYRAGILSWISLVFQLGGLLASLLCGMLIGCVGIKGVWFGTGIVLLVVLLAGKLLY